MERAQRPLRSSHRSGSKRARRISAARLLEGIAERLPRETRRKRQLEAFAYGAEERWEGASGRIEPRRVLRCSQPLLEALVCIGEPPLRDAERVDQLGCLARAA